MEGLIPMVYRSLKKNKTRRKYECLSTGAAQSYNISDFYVKEDDDKFHYLNNKTQYSTPQHDKVSFHETQYSTPQHDKVSSLGGAHHRRYNSVQVDRAHGVFALEDDAAAKPKPLVRFRSHRMFSCVTGA